MPSSRRTPSAALREKHPGFITFEESPLNGGPPPHLLRRSLVTPTEFFFVRSHAAVPAVDPRRYRFSVSGKVRQPLRLTLAGLEDRFAKHEVLATLTCAGYRRRGFLSVGSIRDEIPWDGEAIGTARWGGVLLRDVLLAAGIDPSARHAAFTALDSIERDGRTFGYGCSIPIGKATSKEVLLAYEMNGEPLSPVHGFPLRVVVPGYIGARSVKWVSAVTLQPRPSSNHFQAEAYRLLLSRPVRSGRGRRTGGVALGPIPLNSFIAVPKEGDRLAAGSVLVEGYAVTGDGSEIERVEVSADKGRTWITAELLGESHPWAWRFWQASFKLPTGPHRLMVRAWDAESRTQPEDPSTIWNLRGYVNNSWHRVSIRLAD